MKRKILLTLSAMTIGLAMAGALTACDLFGGGDKGESADGTQGLYYRLTEDGLSYGVELPSGTKDNWEDATL